MNDALLHIEIPAYPLLHRGKVRDLFRLDDDHVLMVASDRLSAFDVVLPDGIPDKGRILTEISRYWCQRLAPWVRHHQSERSVADYIKDPGLLAILGGRGQVVKYYRPLPIEAVVRGYLIGSGWQAYRAQGAVCGIRLPSGLCLAERLPEPIFTPTTKAAVGEHDQPLSFDEVVALLGGEVAERVRAISLILYREAVRYAETRGILIADTKFEFALDELGEIVVIDELLTPDSSRFWPSERYCPGQNPPSFDKQYVRDYLVNSGWDKVAPPPRLPPEVIGRTQEKYREALIRLTRIDA